MNGKSAFDELFRRDQGAKLNSHGQEPLNDPEPDDSYESHLGDGRNARHQVYAVIMIENDGSQWVIPYGTVCFGKGKENGKEFRFRCVLDEHLYEVTVEGPQIQYAVEKFAAGKRETWHCRGHGTERIRVAEVKEAKPTAKKESAPGETPEMREHSR
jgi:hypothetical protein